MSSPSNNTERWKSWEGRVVDGKFPLRQWLGGSDHSAVFLTERSAERSGPASGKAAIKLIAGPSDPEQQFSRWRAAARFSHPHLLRIFDAGQSQLDGEPVLYLVTEYAEEDLSQILPQRPLTPAETSDLLPPVLDAVAYLHGKGYVHTAIKPSNLLAVGDDLKLSADRICKAGDTNSSAAYASVYDAPEIATVGISTAADAWSIGVSIVAALTQHPPAEPSTHDDLAVPNTLPEPFRGIARMCLRRDAIQRATIAEIQAKLRPAPAPPTSAPAVSTSTPASSPHPLSPDLPVESPGSRWRFRVAIVCGILIVAFLIGRKLFHGDETPVQSTAKIEDAAPQTAAPAPQPVPTAPSPQAGADSTNAAPTNASPANTPLAENHPAKTPPAKTPAKPSSNNSAQGDVVRRALPDVPRSASRTISGTIKITVHVDVDSSGKVTSAKVTHAGSSEYFTRLALQAAQRWEFSPSPGAWNLRFQFKKSGVQAFSAKAR